MIFDSSAILAILFEEREASRLLVAVANADALLVGAPTLAETGIVLGNRLGFEKRILLMRFVQGFGVTTCPFEDSHWQEAVDAYARFGKGRHPASLNFGDCLTYAAARLSGHRLLCVGDDFRHTDLPLQDY